MNKKQQVLSLLAVSMLVFTCTPPQNASQDYATNRPEFNPKPTPAYLSPEESLKTMHVPRGFHLELVASEHMIKEPVAIAWDGNAKMYVAEMMTYMQDADAGGEQQTRSRISLIISATYILAFPSQAIATGSFIMGSLATNSR